MDTFKLAKGMIIGVIGAIIIGTILVIVLVCKGCSVVQEKGLKGVMSEVWEGTNKVEETAIE